MNIISLTLPLLDRQTTLQMLKNIDWQKLARKVELRSLIERKLELEVAKDFLLDASTEK